MISAHLLNPNNNYDFVALQEVWCKVDYETLASKLAAVYPHCVYFPSGVIGSGLAILSRHPINQSFFRRFSLCGSPDRFWHGDFYSGKGIGGVRARWRNTLTINFYTTHMHAEYGGKRKGYEAHRLTQFQEIVQFIEQTGRPEHISIIGGDFNTWPDEFIYEMMVEHGCANKLDKPLIDAWKHVHGQEDLEAGASDSSAVSEPVDSGETYCLHTNAYSKRGKKGQRIDYVFYAPRPGLDCISANVLADESGNGQDGRAPISFSDHNLLMAEFRIQPQELFDAQGGNSIVAPSAELMAKQKIDVEKTIAILVRKKRHVRNWQGFHTFVAILFLLVFIGITIATAVTIPNDQLTPLLILALFGIQPAVLVTMFTGIIMARLFLQEEKMSLTHYINGWYIWLLHNEQLEPTAKLITKDE